MRANVDISSCAACGLCESICPEVFHLDNDDISIRTAAIASEIRGSCQEAMRRCPTDAISLRDE